MEDLALELPSILLHLLSLQLQTLLQYSQYDYQKSQKHGTIQPRQLKIFIIIK